ncbi:hypothetical protein ACRAWB_18305 [Leifsonia poae]|uniref:hypothetical protein n=1 Tax=Leifsonia poae TaxID=110933 RepID=UPI003D691C70
MDREYLTPADVCELIPGMTVRTLAEMRARRRAGVRGAKAGPEFSAPSRTVIVYSQSDVHDYLRDIKR